MEIMEKKEFRTTRKNLHIRGLVQFILVGILFVIIQDKEVLAYFLSFETILTILFFGVVGGLLYPWTTQLMAKLFTRFKKQE